MLKKRRRKRKKKTNKQKQSHKNYKENIGTKLITNTEKQTEEAITEGTILEATGNRLKPCC